MTPRFRQGLPRLRAPGSAIEMRGADAMPPHGGRSGVRRWIGRALLATVVPALLLEAVLQLSAWVVSREAVRDTPHEAPGTANAATRSATVLCVGDSYTYGIGASGAAASYPARLEAHLRERTGAQWLVHNGGWPGRNSRDLLAELPGQLERHAPGWVCILVGTNDDWSRPALVTGAMPAEALDDGEYRLEWRTRRLAALVWNAWVRGAAVGEGARAAAAAAAGANGAPDAIGPEGESLLGAWLLEDGVVRFERDGRCWFRERERRWSCTGDTLEIAAADDLPAVRARWRMQRKRVAVQLEGAAAEVVLRPATRRRPAVDAAVRQALDAGRVDEARARLAELLSEPPATGHAAACCLAAQIAIERGAASVALARELLERFPDEVDLWALLAEQAQQSGDEAAATAALDRALALAPAGEPVLRADLRRLDATVHRRADPARALASLAECYRLDGDRDRAAALLRIHFSRNGERDPERAIATQVQDPAARERLEALQRVAVSSLPVADVLEAHLRQAVALCRSLGATPVVLGYPFRDRNLHEVLDRLASDDDLRRVTLHHEFDRLQKTAPRETWFVPDGHCNDAGYEIVARLVAEALLR